jgi:hypothetical protein
MNCGARLHDDWSWNTLLLALLYAADLWQPPQHCHRQPRHPHQTTKALLLLQSTLGNVDTGIFSSHEGTRPSPFIVDDLSAETSSPLRQSSLPPRSANQGHGGVHSNPDTSVITPPIVQQDDRDAHSPLALLLQMQVVEAGWRG